MECLFCKIIKKEIPAKIAFEDKEILAFHDINPIAPVHILIIPKKHIESINDLRDEERLLVGKMILTARALADKLGISKGGYKLLFRVGENGGQEIPHIHLHLIGGAKLSENIRPIE